MTDHAITLSPQRAPAFWGPVSLGLPFAALVAAFLIVASASKGVGGDMVGPAFLVYAAVAVGIVAVLGAGAAIRAIARNERWIVMAFFGLLLNGALVLLGCFYGSILFR